MLGTPLGHPDFVESHLERVAHKQQFLVEGGPTSKDTRQDCGGAWRICCRSTQISATRQCKKQQHYLFFGGLVLRSAIRTRIAAFWASWSDCLPMIQARHPTVAAQLLRQLEGLPASPTSQEAAMARREFCGVRATNVEADGGRRKSY